ncbi:Disulfide bond formation protein D [Nocardioides aquaticus]|uniref:Disulfide bond formation protein D n=1 Tax=Nocardioides aquaticus TaxID=160826 RepID=A0ABX8EGU0_9ACTN|nr:thioredoxin domain-containing protein [Nocardioides aquaticus]QVT79312.1 Disulfide bond formation protein D [Nocardioides aquaticus]
MRTQTKGGIGVILIALIAIGAVLFLNRGEAAPAAVEKTSDGEDSLLVREDSQVVGEPARSGNVTMVEFLDFECEACGAVYPAVEQLRAEYDGRVTFVARYFPLPGHVNAEPAARAVESAARQGEFEAMYQMMYETQAEWGESQEPKDDLFRSYAEDLGLDMEQYDADFASPEVAARVQRDVDDGMELGVQGTPTFYLDGELLQPRTYEDFTQALDEALES